MASITCLKCFSRMMWIGLAANAFILCTWTLNILRAVSRQLHTFNRKQITNNTVLDNSNNLRSRTRNRIVHFILVSNDFSSYFQCDFFFFFIFSFICFFWIECNQLRGDLVWCSRLFLVLCHFLAWRHFRKRNFFFVAFSLAFCALRTQIDHTLNELKL